MSNERIDQILEENGIEMLHQFKTGNPGFYDNICKSMEQYAMESSKDGFCAGSDAVHKLLRPEIDRLQALVQAQKELIEWLEKDFLTNAEYRKLKLLRNKIKELEP